MTEIGKPERIYIIEPIEDPVPHETPAPDEHTVEVPTEAPPEEVPA